MRIWQRSEPDRTRSLLNRRLNLGQENLATKPLGDLGRVRLTLDDQPLPQDAPAGVIGRQPHLRQEEMFWLANQAGPYAGQWVALSSARLVAHGAMRRQSAQRPAQPGSNVRS